LQLILIDTSASMQGEPIAEALKSANQIIEGIPAKDAIAVATFADQLHPLLTAARALEIPASERKSTATHLLNSIKAEWFAAKLDASLLTAVTAATEAAGAGRPVKIHLFSDFKKGAAIESLRGEEWPDTLEIIRHPISPKEDWTNAGIHVLANDRVRISNAEGSAKSDFKIQWSGNPQVTSINVAPGESAIVDAPPGLSPDGTVKLTGDDFAFDNEAAWARPIRPTAKIRYLGTGEKSDSTESLFFLSRAMQPTPAYEIDIRPDAPSPDLTVASGAMNPADLDSFIAHLKAGGNGLLTIRDTRSAEALAKILNLPASETREATVNDFALLGQIDFDSSIFSPFADPRYSDFSSIRFWKYRVLPAPLIASAKILARFDSGDPAWLQFSIGKGTLHVLTTTWRPADSQLALSPKFPPLLHSLLSQSPALAIRAGQYQIGDPVQLPVDVTSVTLPDQSTEKSAAVFKATRLPGIYHAGPATFAVQLVASESEITPLSETDFRSLGLPLDPPKSSAAQALATARLSNTEQENRQRVGWWLLVATVAVFLAETLWAARRRTARPTSPAAA
jgi:hypothetical protein